MAYASIVCYHHSNCDDRPAVSTCSKCGKGLCAECTDKLRSPETGKILCVDCLNAELREGAKLAVQAKDVVKREIVGMIVGGIIGIILMAVLIPLLATTPFLFLAFFMPTLFASFFTLFHFARRRGFFLGILFFFFGMIASPIVFIWRLVVRIKNIKTLKDYAAYQVAAQETNKLFFETARKMKSTRQLEQENAAKFKAEYEKGKAEIERMRAQLTQEQMDLRIKQLELQLEQEHAAAVKEAQKRQAEAFEKAAAELGAQRSKDKTEDIANIVDSGSTSRTTIKVDAA